jgi:L-ascorbate metabolism protein UlaG (beta-lactamase superfamily)
MKTIAGAIAVMIAALMAGPAWAQNVKVTPLGGETGEFCLLDRALIFEDPNGTRLLYDPGVSVAGPDDPRLGKIDAVLISHMHFDHVGGARTKAVDAGECGKPDRSVKAAPNTNAVNIALGKNAKIVSGSEMPPFFAGKLKALGGNPKNSILARFGATKEVGGVKISTVPASHSNGLSPAFIGGELGKMMKAAGFSGYVGPPTGFVVRFSNGLAVYLSGDTGITAEQKTVVHDYYAAKLAVINIGDNFTTGPTEAAFVINDLVKPASVIVSHANEPATSGGVVKPGTRTDTFIKAVKVPALVPLSGRTMEFGPDGKCAKGCG